MKILLFLLTMMTIGNMTKLLAANDIAHGCRAGETEIGMCNFEASKDRLFSICLAPHKEVVSVRLGTIVQSEVEAEFSPSQKIYRWIDSSTYVTFFGFNSAGFSYVFGVPQETIDARAFLFINKAGAPLDFGAPNLCETNSFGDKSVISDAIQDVDDKEVRNCGFVFPPAAEQIQCVP